ncbi:CDK-activating kinase assembly factor MAT1 [Lates japonicus]|uniref:CDK-activating kinase assembly factor MAT1 n=1 Tax=Lates japonicus TaxID=270547 RepID=A0AAD3RKG5_LATJO|nr:CDK-activating kinase assembly factor MAT1 [Lates japonicus]
MLFLVNLSPPQTRAEELEELLLLEQQGNEQAGWRCWEEQKSSWAEEQAGSAGADCLRVHGCEIIKSLLPVIVLQAALSSFCDSKASWLHCVELWALEEQSQLPATILLAQHKVRAAQLETQIEQQKQTVKPTNLFSTGIHMRQTVSLMAVPKVEEVLYHYKPLQVKTYGPPVPELEQLGRLGYLNHVRAAMPQDTAGGYTSALACHRAVQDAFSGLFPPKG